MAVLLTYAASLVIIINPYGCGGNINYAKLYERLEQAKQSFGIKYDNGGDDTHPVLNNKCRNYQFTRSLISPGKYYYPEDHITPRTHQASIPEEAERIGKRSSIPFLDVNYPRRSSRSTTKGVM